MIPMLHHTNIRADDDCRLVIEFDEDCQLQIDAGTLCEFVEKVCAKKHPRVQDIVDRLLPTLRRAGR